MPRLMAVLMLLGPAFAAADDAVTNDGITNDVITNDGTTRISLRVQLERGLRAMRPVEFQFLSQILAQVKAGTLPKNIVEKAFLWARRQPRYRVQYFEKALQALAKRNKITLTATVSSFDPGYNRPVR